MQVQYHFLYDALHEYLTTIKYVTSANELDHKLGQRSAGHDIVAEEYKVRKLLYSSDSSIRLLSFLYFLSDDVIYMHCKPIAGHGKAHLGFL